MFRHGDVIIVPTDSIPAQAIPRPAAILARGEATGHSHRIENPRSVELFDHEGMGYMRVTAPMARLVHDEHHPIELQHGTYRFWMQREYSPKEIRRIVD
ncbi:MAG TPA: hypothetical protein VFE47_18890 [Tepidisphaeraceae bacterium]|jgi:hypothetical protein|nr:hypothetical protein [Tepidisphaeraceae bacterium]